VVVFNHKENVYVRLQAIKGSRTVSVAGREETAAVGGNNGPKICRHGCALKVGTLWTEGSAFLSHLCGGQPIASRRQAH
jgi:hypothetical protein